MYYFFFNFIYLHVECWSHILQHTCANQRKTCRSQFSHSTLRILEIKFSIRQSGKCLYLLSHLAGYTCTFKRYILLIYYVCMHLEYVEVRGNLQELVLSFYHTDPEDGTWVIRLGSKYLYPMSHLISPLNVFLTTELFKVKHNPLVIIMYI